MTSYLFHGSHGKENMERAMMPFILGSVAVSADQDVTIFLTVEGVWCATKGYASSIVKEGFKPLNETINDYLDNSGKIWVCGACTGARGITQDQIIEGAKIVTADMVVEYMATGVQSISW